MSRDLFINRLKNHTHTLRYKPLSDLFIDIQSQQNICFVGLTKSSLKEEFIEYSDPFLRIFAQQFIILNENKSRFSSYINAQNKIDLYRLFQNNGLSLVYQAQRPYGSFVDQLIFLNKEKSHLVKKKSSESHESIIRLLFQEQFDYMIEYPTTIDFIKEKQHFDKKITSFFIDSSPEFEPLYVGCSKTLFGKKTIKRINQIIQQNRSFFKSFYRSWLNDELKHDYEKRNP